MGKRMWSGLCVAATAVTFAACGGDSPDAADQPAPPAPAAEVGAGIDLPEGVTLAMVSEGRTVFETTTCFTCHGMDGSGTALAPSLRDQDWLNSDGSYDGIVGVVRNGVAQPRQYPAPMPAMGGAQLTEDQIRQVAAYVYAISHGG
ncbi:MAG TPA: c-type cytochrome [Longimicrobiales bacterium]|nr:c-type cytochrome [Longimicrobiales bacterium]